MGNQTGNDWTAILSRLNALIIQSNDLEDELSPNALHIGWCGSLPATEDEILKAEERFGVKLPPSYRSFLLISNGWRPFDSLIERLLAIEEIERYRDADPDNLASILKWEEDDVLDCDYLDYDNPEHRCALRHRYYPESLLVGRGWGVESERVLLNPQIVSSDGEWETIYFANWIPGNYRYRSFLEFVAKQVGNREKFS